MTKDSKVNEKKIIRLTSQLITRETAELLDRAKAELDVEDDDLEKLLKEQADESAKVCPNSEDVGHVS